MSTYMYLVCPAHKPHERASEESGQHHYDLPTIRFNWLRRDHWLAYIERFPDTLTREFDHLSYFERNTFAFFLEHKTCGRVPYIESEYGDRFTICADSIADLLDEMPALRAGGAA